MWMEPTDGAKPLTPLRAVLYVASVIAIAWVFEFFPSGWLERLTAETSSRTLLIFGFASGWGLNSGEAYLTLIGGARDVSATIIRECTAMHVFAMFAGLVLPLGGGLWRRKLLSLALAGPVLFALNISRVALTVVLTAFDVPPFAWVFTNPTVETYHYPLSFAYGIFGVALLIIMIGRWTLPELGDTLIGISNLFIKR